MARSISQFVYQTLAFLFANKTIYSVLIHDPQGSGSPPLEGQEYLQPERRKPRTKNLYRPTEGEFTFDSILASNSCEAAERIENSIGVDKFSNLPDEIALKIMSVLSFKDLTRVGCVSKRFKTLQLSVPSIYLSVPEGENGGNMLDSFNSFMNERGDNKIQKFQFSCFDLGGDTIDDEKLKARLSRWINNAVRCNVEEVSITAYLSRRNSLFSLPSALFLCGSLRSLLVFTRCVIGGEVSSFPSLSNLANLNLACVSVIDESFWRWISCSCKRLKALSLSDIHGSKNIIIESPTLKTFHFYQRESDCCNLSICANRLEHIGIDWDFISSNQSLSICTPNAKRFDCYGTLPSHLNLREMGCLNNCTISCYRNVPDSAALVDVLYCVRWVTTLGIDDRVLKTLSQNGTVFSLLNEVRCLKVRCLFTDDVVPGLLWLLQRTPSLRSLCFKSTDPYAGTAAAQSKCRGFDMEWWKLQKLAFVDHLKNMAIFMLHGSNISEFARYILNNARNLERMDIFCVTSQYDDALKLQDEMISNGTVIIHQFMEDIGVYLEMIKFMRHFDKY